MSNEEEQLNSNPPIKEAILQQGFFVCNFEQEACCPAFSYTIGLRESRNHPEFLCMGLSVEMNSYLIATAAEAVLQGTKFRPKQEYHEFLDGVPVKVVPILEEHLDRHFGFGIEYYGTSEFDALQIVWPDRDGRWPWDDSCDEELSYCRKLLDRDPHFAFYAPANLRTFCSKGIFESNKPILDAIHQDDGEWQFLSDEPCTPENMMLVCLEEITKQDPTINELFDLPYGTRASRKQVGGDWETESYSDE